MILQLRGTWISLLLSLWLSGCYRIHPVDEEAPGDASPLDDESCDESLDGYLVYFRACAIQSAPFLQEIVTPEGLPCHMDLFWSESRPQSGVIPEVCDTVPVTSTCLMEMAGIGEALEEGSEVTEIALTGSWQSMPVCRSTAKCALSEECSECGWASVFVPCE